MATNPENEKLMPDYAAAAFFILAMFIVGVLSFSLGKSHADAYYAKTPVITEYRRERIVVETGDVICPEGHTCQWRAWDLDTNSEVPPQH